MISTRLVSIVRCPDCRGRFERGESAMVCPRCGREVATGGDHLDLRPSDQYAERTKYLDEALHADARHETVSPPLLAAKVRNDLLRRVLAPAPGDVVVDLGCGSGRVALWNADLGAATVGVDVSPFFAVEARAAVDLVLGDLRRLPFADGTFTKGYALDVLEHLSRDTLAEVLREATRVLSPGGALFVYSHVRRNSPLALGLRLVNRAARALERVGLVDLSQERLRKSDHQNPLADVPDLERTIADAGLRIAWIRYYTPIIGGFVENILVRIAEQAVTRRMARRAAAGSWGGEGARAARAEAKRQVARKGPVFAALTLLSWIMKLDVVLLGRVRSGPFFALLVKDGRDPVPVR